MTIVTQSENLHNPEIKPDWHTLGADDARGGMHCIPEMYTVNQQSTLLYCFGYESVKPGTLTATYFIDQRPATGSAVPA